MILFLSRLASFKIRTLTNLSPLASDPASKLNILRHNGNPLCMNRAKVSVLEQPNEVGLSSFLKRRNGATLKTQIGLEVLRDFPHESLKRKLPDEKLGALLILSDFPQRHGSRPEAVGLLHSSGRGSGLPGGLGRQLLTWRLAAGGLASSLLSTSHVEVRP